MAESPDGKILTVYHRSRDAVMQYVYPVVSRRSDGVSVGINLNTNHACNWHCAYCQVPDLQRGSAPPVDLPLLAQELRAMLTQLMHGDFMQRRVPEQMRVVRDIAFSGDGEPTSAHEFADAIALVAQIRAEFGLNETVAIRVISNGSLVDKSWVQDGLRVLAAQRGGELWFKMDSVTPAGLRRMNGTRMSPSRLQNNLRLAAGLCPTWIQTCVLAWDGKPPSSVEQESWLAAVAGLTDSGVRGVLLYGLARPSMQEAAPHLSALPASWLEAYAEKIRALGLPVKVFA